MPRTQGSTPSMEVWFTPDGFVRVGSGYPLEQETRDTAFLLGPLVWLNSGLYRTRFLGHS